MRYITAFFMAWGNFFYLPCPLKLWDSGLRRLQLVFLPIIGLFIGLLWYALFVVLSQFEIPLYIKALLLAFFPFKISGFIHLDGFMDCSDAILSRRDMEKKQEILKDSHVGAFAVINVGILFMATFVAMLGKLEQLELAVVSFRDAVPFLFIPVVSRACSAFGVLSFRPMGQSQYVDSFDLEQNRKYLIIIAVLVFGIIALSYFVFYWKIALIVEFIIIVHFATMAYARVQLGGMNGDIAGYALTVSECLAILFWNFL